MAAPQVRVLFTGVMFASLRRYRGDCGAFRCVAKRQLLVGGSRAGSPQTWPGPGPSASPPRTPCHIWCTRRSAVPSAADPGARRAAGEEPPRERSGCRGPDLRGRPTDTVESTWGGQGSTQGSFPHPVQSQRRVLAEILGNETPKLADLLR